MVDVASTAAYVSTFVTSIVLYCRSIALSHHCLNAVWDFFLLMPINRPWICFFHRVFALFFFSESFFRGEV